MELLVEYLLQHTKGTYWLLHTSYECIGPTRQRHTANAEPSHGRNRRISKPSQVPGLDILLQFTRLASFWDACVCSLSTPIGQSRLDMRDDLKINPSADDSHRCQDCGVCGGSTSGGSQPGSGQSQQPSPPPMSGWSFGVFSMIVFLLPVFLAMVGAVLQEGSPVGQVIAGAIGGTIGFVLSFVCVRVFHRPTT